MRLGPVMAGIFIVLTVGWIAGRCFGRSIGVLSAAILATMREFQIYATAPECDIFLAAIVTAVFACFTALRFPKPAGESASLRDPALPNAPQDCRFIGRRPLAM